MNVLTSALYLTLLLSITSGGKLLEFSYTRDVNEGAWARFTCAVKRGKATVRWKIGDYTDEEGSGLKYIGSHGLVVRVHKDTELTEKYKSKGKVDSIEVLATTELDGVPVQCVAYPHGKDSPNEYSKFIILTVHTDINSAYNTSQDTHSQDLPRQRNSRSTTSSSSGAVALGTYTSSTLNTSLLATILVLLGIG